MIASNGGATSEDLLASLSRCTLCGACREGCPTYDATLHEGHSGRGRATLARGLLDGALKDAPLALDFLSACTRCGYCDRICPVQVPVVKSIAAVRARFGNLGFRRRFVFGALLFRPRLLSFCLFLLALWQRLLGRSRNGRIEALPGLGTKKGVPRLPFRSALVTLRRARRVDKDPPRGAVADSAGESRRVRLFVGCRSERVFPELVISAESGLRRAGYDVLIPKDQRCSGFVPEGAGALGVASRLRSLNREALASEEGVPVTTLCASCRRGLKAGGDPPEGGASYEVVDAANAIATAFLKLPLDRRPRSDFEFPKRVFLHVPCSSRALGERDHAVLEFLEDAGLTITRLTGQECCGGAVPFSVDHPELARELGTSLIETTAKVKIGERALLITTDPGCLMHLREVAAAYGRLEVRHAVEIMASFRLPAVP